MSSRGSSYAFAAVLVVLMAVRVFGTVRRQQPNRERSMTAVAIASAALKSLRGIRNVRASAGGTPALVTQSLALARIAGALALGRPVAQVAAAPDAVAGASARHARRAAPARVCAVRRL